MRCAESNVVYPNMTLSRGSGIDSEGTDSHPMKGKVDTNMKFGIGMGEVVSFIFCL